MMVSFAIIGRILLAESDRASAVSPRPGPTDSNFIPHSIPNFIPHNSPTIISNVSPTTIPNTLSRD